MEDLYLKTNINKIDRKKKDPENCLKMQFLMIKIISTKARSQRKEGGKGWLTVSVPCQSQRNQAIVGVIEFMDAEDGG